MPRLISLSAEAGIQRCSDGAAPAAGVSQPFRTSLTNLAPAARLY